MRECVGSESGHVDGTEVESEPKVNFDGEAQKYELELALYQESKLTTIKTGSKAIISQKETATASQTQLSFT